jgi:hypothetical protein
MKINFLFGSIAGCWLLASGYCHADTLCPRVFSTSTDWESVTGLRYAQYDMDFTRDKSIGKKGMELYFLDSFPCIGQARAARAWISPSNISDMDKSAIMYLSCVRKPTEIRFAWREAERDDSQTKTKGVLTCYPSASGRKLSVRLQDCVKGKDWEE